MKTQKKAGEKTITKSKAEAPAEAVKTEAPAEAEEKAKAKAEATWKAAFALSPLLRQYQEAAAATEAAAAALRLSEAAAKEAREETEKTEAEAAEAAAAAVEAVNRLQTACAVNGGKIEVFAVLASIEGAKDGESLLFNLSGFTVQLARLHGPEASAEAGRFPTWAEAAAGRLGLTVKRGSKGNLCGPVKLSDFLAEVTKAAAVKDNAGLRASSVILSAVVSRWEAKRAKAKAAAAVRKEEEAAAAVKEAAKAAAAAVEAEAEAAAKAAPAEAAAKAAAAAKAEAEAAAKAAAAAKAEAKAAAA